MSVLHVAIEADNLEQLRGALKCGIKPEEKNSRGYTALQYLLTRPTINIEMIKLLIEYGADKNTQQCGTGDTLLHIALSKNDKGLLAYAFSIGVDVSIQNNSGDQPGLNFLYDALVKGDEKEILAALDLILTVHNYSRQELNNLTPIRWVITHYPEMRTVIEAMIKKGANRDAIDQQGRDLLHLALLSGDLGRIVWALELGVNPVSSIHQGILINKQTQNPHFFDIAEILIKKINEYNKNNLALYQRNANQHTLLDLAILSRNEANVEKVLAMGFDIQHVIRITYQHPVNIFFSTLPLNYKIFSLLVQHGVNCNATNADGNNLLDLAIAAGDKTLIGQALDLGIDPFRKSPSAIEQALLAFPNDSSIAEFIKDYKPNLVQVISRSPSSQQAACSSTSTDVAVPNLKLEIDNLFGKENSGQLIYEALIARDLDSDTITYLGRKPNAKRLVFNYILESKDLCSKLDMIKNASLTTTQIGAFFWVQRVFWSKPSMEKGYLAKLVALQKEVEAAIAEENKMEEGSEPPSNEPTSSYANMNELMPSAPPLQEEGLMTMPTCSSHDRSDYPGMYPFLQRPEYERAVVSTSSSSPG